MGDQPLPELSQTLALAQSMAVRVGDLIRPPADMGLKIPDAQWTVGEMAAHLAHAKALMARLAARESVRYSDGTREGLADANAETLAGFGERDGAVLAGMIEGSVADFCRSIAPLDSQQLIDGPVGSMSPQVFSAYLLTHLMQHGETIARTLNKPTILDAPSVVAALPFILFSLEHFADQNAIRNLKAAYEVRLRGGPRFYATFDRGTVRVTTEPVGRVDCHISADPVAMFRVGVRLTAQWGPIAQFKLTTWGMKPWLAFRFAGTFLPP